ncbi:acyl carrier protein [Dactylosporangium sp. AC04546]|uniref:acyl carrier protein n=1 Tax=Dactylosporangium sp. AC04546 TaxID=2862460 RepID=UPI001EDEF5CE|nr:acyl carrier protein [Dactylosporangium sp. AC04546]WVK88760.1 acyl carrier protein [Dactylosporangium sp. AC04546]
MSETAATSLRPLIRDAWISVLGHAEFTDDDYFFAIGGTSLDAIRLMRSIGQATGRRLPVRTVFEHQTVALLDAAVRDLLAETPA